MSNQTTNQSFFSISFSYRLGLGFHALNNEGSDGSNLMQPRNIDVGEITYDGISGEIIRRHILENFVMICRNEKIPMLPMSEGLHPDRGIFGIRASAKTNGDSELSNNNLMKSIRKSVLDCAVLDAGGFLAAFPSASKQGNFDNSYIVEGTYIQNHCASMSGEINPVKRDSCFDVAWLISEEPQDIVITQHSAFRSTASNNSRYSQSMRSNVYGGIIRLDLHRIGMDDNWHYQENQKRLVITPEEQLRRQNALIRAVVDFIASPTGAKTAGWAPHVFLTEGVIVVSPNRTAPFISPTKVDLSNKERPVSLNNNYKTLSSQLDKTEGIEVLEFDSAKGLIDSLDKILNKKEQSNVATS